MLRDSVRVSEGFLTRLYDGLVYCVDVGGRDYGRGGGEGKVHTKKRISHPSNAVSSWGRREYQVILFSCPVLRIVETCGKHRSRIAAPRVCMYVLSTCRVVCCTRLVCLSAYYFAQGDSFRGGDMVLLAVAVWFMLDISAVPRPRPSTTSWGRSLESKAKQGKSKSSASSTHLKTDFLWS